MLDCNRHSLSVQIIEKNLEGWWYDYYEVESNGNIMSTKMACPNKSLTKKFVYISPKIFNYNSQMPLVFYVPKNFVVKYKIYKSDQNLKDAKHGSDTTQSSKISYRKMEHYFIKNYAKPPKNNRLENIEQLENVFGYASTMTNKPTQINFDNEFVVPIIFKETKCQTDIEITDVGFNYTPLTISYKIIKGRNLGSYTIKPFHGFVFEKSI
jgi:hypothetical protein